MSPTPSEKIPMPLLYLIHDPNGHLCMNYYVILYDALSLKCIVLKHMEKRPVIYENLCMDSFMRYSNISQMIIGNHTSPCTISLTTTRKKYGTILLK